MSYEDQIKWVTLTLDFPPDQEARSQEWAQAGGLSLKFYSATELEHGLTVLTRNVRDFARFAWTAERPDHRAGSIPAQLG